MFLRALFAFLALPGIVAFAIPIYWLVSTSRTELAQPRTHGAEWDDYTKRVRRWL